MSGQQNESGHPQQQYWPSWPDSKPLTCCDILGLNLNQNRTDAGRMGPFSSNSASTLAHLLVFIVIFCPCQGMHHVRVGGFGVEHEDDQQETEAELLDRAAKGDFRKDMKELNSTECSALVNETEKDSTQNIPASQQSLMSNGNVRMKWANREEYVISTNWVNYLCGELFSRFIFNKYTMKTMKKENSLVSIISANDPGDIFFTSWANLTLHGLHFWKVLISQCFIINAISRTSAGMVLS